ncbi:hypothetical protein J4558_23800 [Leptolyngbya sp. 15MV]|nr:hypothetical protein J4558_23800 [Leptolyngbya sp. 15MV]
MLDGREMAGQDSGRRTRRRAAIAAPDGPQAAPAVPPVQPTFAFLIPHDDAPAGPDRAPIDRQKYDKGGLTLGGKAFARSLRIRTAEQMDYLARRYGLPLEALHRWAAMDTRALAQFLGCTMYDAASLQIRCLSEALPYTATRLVALDLTADVQGSGTAPVQINVAPEMAALLAAHAEPDAARSWATGIVANQRLADDHAGATENGASENRVVTDA